jgi:hypothetical protein
MNVEVYASLIPLAGVLVGGGLAYVAQRVALRSAEQSDTRRQAVTRAEARRAERMTIVDRLLAGAQDVERIAAERHYAGVSGTEWRAKADAAMDRLWVAEKMVRILCSLEMHDAAHEFVTALKDALDRPPEDFDLWGHLAPTWTALLDAARVELGGNEQPARHANQS